MAKYDLEAIPVVDEMRRLVGRITIDDIVDVIEEPIRLPANGRYYPRC